MKECVQKLDIPYCLAPQCNGVVKPDIVFFGEPLPARFFQQMSKVGEADLVIIMGTSLQVMPFAVLPQRANEETPRVLINLERVGGIGSRKDDVLMLENCDAGVRRLAKYLGWLDELEELWGRTDPNKKLDKGKNKQNVYDGPMDMDEVLRAQVESLSRDVEKGLKLADRHRHSVSHQLRLDQERKNTVPFVRSAAQQESRESGSFVTGPGTPAASQTVMTPISTTEPRPLSPATINSIEAPNKDDSVSGGKGKEAVKDNPGASTISDNTTVTSP